jgi:hypothetical protein
MGWFLTSPTLTHPTSIPQVWLKCNFYLDNGVGKAYRGWPGTGNQLFPAYLPGSAVTVRFLRSCVLEP